MIYVKSIFSNFISGNFLIVVYVELVEATTKHNRDFKSMNLCLAKPNIGRRQTKPWIAAKPNLPVGNSANNQFTKAVSQFLVSCSVNIKTFNLFQSVISASRLKVYKYKYYQLISKGPTNVESREYYMEDQQHSHEQHSSNSAQNTRV